MDLEELNCKDAQVINEIERLAPYSPRMPFEKQYGAVTTAAVYCGFKAPPAPLNGEWQHGHIIPERNLHPEYVLGSDGLARGRKNWRFYVARSDQKEYLESEGFSDVTAIGLPIIYVKKPEIERVTNSLLVMPGHTLPEDKITIDESQYVEYIASLKPNFSRVICCVHKNCLDTGLWVNSMKRIGVPSIRGASLNDANSLKRMALLFSYFDVVTSYSFGSHFAYAAYFGARVSWSGPNPIKARDVSQHVLFKNAPELIDLYNKLKEDRILEDEYSLLSYPPSAAQALSQWASYQLGEEHKKTPSELKTLFGWRYFERTIRTAKKVLRNQLRKAYKRY